MSIFDVLRQDTEDLLKAVAKSTQTAVTSKAKKSLESAVSRSLQGIFGELDSEDTTRSRRKRIEVEDDEQDDDEQDEDEHYKDAGEGLLFPEGNEGSVAIAFDDVGKRAATNMLRAVGVWSALLSSENAENLVVAWHLPSSRAVVGDLDAIFDYMQHNDLPIHLLDDFQGLPAQGLYKSETGWRLTRDASILESIEVPDSVMADVEKMLNRKVDAVQLGTKFSESGTATSKFEDFHWGEKSRVVSVAKIDGVLPTAQVFLMGVARKLVIFCESETGVCEKYVEFSAEYGFPAVYGVGGKGVDKVILIHGIGKYISSFIAKRELQNLRAEQQYNKLQGRKERSIDGIVPGSNLCAIGVGKQIYYGAKKGKEFVEYYHDFGEHTKEFPSVFLLEDDSLVITGGNMVIEPRGVVE